MCIFIFLAVINIAAYHLVQLISHQGTCIYFILASGGIQTSYISPIFADICFETFFHINPNYTAYNDNVTQFSLTKTFRLFAAVNCGAIFTLDLLLELD